MARPSMEIFQCSQASDEDLSAQPVLCVFEHTLSSLLEWCDHVCTAKSRLTPSWMGVDRVSLHFCLVEYMLTLLPCWVALVSVCSPCLCASCEPT